MDDIGTKVDLYSEKLDHNPAIFRRIRRQGALAGCVAQWGYSQMQLKQTAKVKVRSDAQLIFNCLHTFQQSSR